MMNRIKRFGTALPFAMTAAAMPMNAHADLAGDISIIRPAEKSAKGVYAEAEAFYTVPGGADGYTFIDLNQDGKGYFGKTMITKPLAYGIGPRLQAIHPNELFERAGLGLSASVPGMPEWAEMSIYWMGLWVNADGERPDTTAAFGFNASAKLPYRVNTSVFGEWSQDGDWLYGEGCIGREISLGKGIGTIRLGYNPALLENGSAVPKVQHRLRATISF